MKFYRRDTILLNSKCLMIANYLRHYKWVQTHFDIAPTTPFHSIDFVVPNTIFFFFFLFLFRKCRDVLVLIVSRKDTRVLNVDIDSVSIFFFVLLYFNLIFFVWWTAQTNLCALMWVCGSWYEWKYTSNMFRPLYFSTS